MVIYGNKIHSREFFSEFLKLFSTKIKAGKNVFKMRKTGWSDSPILTANSNSATPKTYSLLGGVDAFFFVCLCN